MIFKNEIQLTEDVFSTGVPKMSKYHFMLYYGLFGCVGIAQSV